MATSSNGTLRRTPQLSPDEIENRLMRGQEIVLATSEAQRKRLITTYKLPSSDQSDYQNAAKFFWMSGRFPHVLVKKMPWSVLLELSRPTKDEETRYKLAWLCMLWSDANSYDPPLVPSVYAFPSEKPLVMPVLNHHKNYIEDLRTLFAQAKKAGLIDQPLEVGEENLLDIPTPDIVNRVREEMGIVVSRGVEAAILKVRTIAGASIIKAEQLNHVEQTGMEVKAALEQVQEYLQSLQTSDDAIILRSLKAHAEQVERRLQDALTLNEDLLDRAETAERERDAYRERAERAESEGLKLASKLSTVATMLDMLNAELKPSSNNIAEVIIDQFPESAQAI